jgi:hypothetical protein
MVQKSTCNSLQVSRRYLILAPEIDAANLPIRISVLWSTNKQSAFLVPSSSFINWRHPRFSKFLGYFAKLRTWQPFFGYRGLVRNSFFPPFKDRGQLVIVWRVFWDVTPCSPVEVHRLFGGTYYLNSQGSKNMLRKQLSAWPETSKNKKEKENNQKYRHVKSSSIVQTSCL